MHPVLIQIGSLIVPSYGAVASLGVLLALGLAQWTGKCAGLNPRHGWNMLVLAVFAALAASRLVLILVNLSDLRHHPSWLLAIAMVHHPLLAAAGVASGAIAILLYARWARLPFGAVGDCLAAPISLGMAFEQFAALLAGSDYGRPFPSSWAITYTSPLAARWSGAPLGIPLYPVQSYAAAGALSVAAICCGWFLLRHRPGDIAGVWFVATGGLLFITECFRDWEGRGVLFDGAYKNPVVDLPQLVGLGLVIVGGAALGNWRNSSRKNEGAQNVRN